MDCSYPSIYQSYVNFCKLRGCPYPCFEDWMHQREPEPKKTPAQEFMEEFAGNARQLATSQEI